MMREGAQRRKKWKEEENKESIAAVDPTIGKDCK